MDLYHLPIYGLNSRTGKIIVILEITVNAIFTFKNKELLSLPQNINNPQRVKL